MVYAFFIQTLGPKECAILYSRFYNSYTVKDGPGKESRIFESCSDKKALVKTLCRQVQMHSEMKRSHSLIPPGLDTAYKGIFTLRGIPESGAEMFVAWHGTACLGFSLLLDSLDNQLQAHAVLSTLFEQLEKHLLVFFLSILSFIFYRSFPLFKNS